MPLDIVISEPIFLFFNLVKDFQSLIVGVIGFAGVIITIIVNNYLLRKQEMYIINQKRMSISVAIATDLKLIAKGLTDTADSVAKFNSLPNSVFFGFDCSCTFETYDALVGDIGFLDQHVALKVVESRYLIRSFFYKIKALETKDIAICNTREFYDNQDSKSIKFQDPTVIKEVIELTHGYSKELRKNSELIHAQIKIID